MIGKRIKELRKNLKLNQTEFGSPLGLNQSTIGGYENGFRNPSDASIIAICREYNVSEHWLRDGEGEMFSGVPASAVSGLAVDYSLDAFDQALIEEYLKLDPASKKVIKEYIKKVCAAEDASIKKELESYEAELRAEKGEKLSLLDIGNAKEA